jgi:transcriptional pleiotropic regulator of transition state genes
MIFCRKKGEIEVKATGIVRKVDELGRVVLPIELRRTLSIAVKDPLEIFIDGEHVILKRYEPACTFCGSADDVIYFQGKNVCGECVTAIHENVKS